MRFELPEAKKLTLEMVIPIRWGDMDAMGHVNNTIYFRYLEIVRIEWLHQVAGAPDPAGEGPVIVNTFCNFLKQLKYPGDVLAKHYVAKPGRSVSVWPLHLELRREAKDDGVHLTCEVDTYALQGDDAPASWRRAQGGGAGRMRGARRVGGGRGPVARPEREPGAQVAP
jgi:acyl-CoA thioesterase FadM